MPSQVLVLLICLMDMSIHQIHLAIVMKFIVHVRYLVYGKNHEFMEMIKLAWFMESLKNQHTSKL